MVAVYIRFCHANSQPKIYCQSRMLLSFLPIFVCGHFNNNTTGTLPNAKKTCVYTPYMAYIRNKIIILD